MGLVLIESESRKRTRLREMEPGALYHDKERTYLRSDVIVGEYVVVIDLGSGKLRQEPLDRKSYVVTSGSFSVVPVAGDSRDS